MRVAVYYNANGEPVIAERIMVWHTRIMDIPDVIVLRVRAAQDEHESAIMQLRVQIADADAL